jgi:hypothetical protein
MAIDGMAKDGRDLRPLPKDTASSHPKGRKNEEIDVFFLKKQQTYLLLSKLERVEIQE